MNLENLTLYARNQKPKNSKILEKLKHVENFDCHVGSIILNFKILIQIRNQRLTKNLWISNLRENLMQKYMAQEVNADVDKISPQ